MKSHRKLLIAALFASAALSTPLAHAAGDDDYASIFVTICEEAPDKKVSKQEVMTVVDAMFDKADTRKEGRLDRSQAGTFSKSLTQCACNTETSRGGYGPVDKQFGIFLDHFTRLSGG